MVIHSLTKNTPVSCHFELVNAYKTVNERLPSALDWRTDQLFLDGHDAVSRFSAFRTP
jgi:hypothetical protein